MGFSPTSEWSTAYEVIAASSTTTDIVNRAGAVLCDRAMHGWKVRVFVDRCSDDRALTIFGVASGGAVAEAQFAPASGVSRTLVVASELFCGNERFSHDVLVASKDCMTELLICGVDAPRGISGLSTFTYPSSAAARAFKAQAQLALGVQKVSRQPEGEQFFRASRRQHAVRSAGSQRAADG